MKISIFGLGYVGAVSAACFAKTGHEVVGVDSQQDKADIINRGQSPIIEKDLDELISSGVGASKLRATTCVIDAIESTELSFVCVGTPSQLNGSLDLTYVRRVCEEIGAELAKKSSFHTVVIRSTMLPGTMSELVIPTLEESSGKTAGIEFGVCNNPEFLRESTAVYDFFNPPKTVIGETDEKSGSLLASLYQELDAPLIRTKVEIAEMVKYSDNAWHAVKVGFANEIGNICKELNIQTQGQFSQIEIKVNPQGHRQTPNQKTYQNSKPINNRGSVLSMSTSTADHFLEIAQNAPKGLKEKLRKLAANANKRG